MAEEDKKPLSVSHAKDHHREPAQMKIAAIMVAMIRLGTERFGRGLSSGRAFAEATGRTGPFRTEQSTGSFMRRTVSD